jgi:hypothetical protein
MFAWFRTSPNPKQTEPFKIKDISATLEWSWDVIHDTCYGFQAIKELPVHQ